MNNTIDIPGEIFTKVRIHSQGVMFTMVDLRHPTPLEVSFIMEPHEEHEYLTNDGAFTAESLFRIECTLGIAIANMVMRNASLN
jgi:hypothetical protein